MVRGIGIIDYGLGNPASVQNMLNRVGLRAFVSGKADELAQADGLVLPGVGHFAAGMQNLSDRGLVSFLRSHLSESQVPFLGICLGMQLLAKHSEEGDVEGLGLVDARIVKFRRETMAKPLPVPHMGWNVVTAERRTLLTAGLSSDSRFYFVHSYYAVTDDPTLAVLTTEYGQRFVSGFQRDNIAGVQFHPEKSHSFGKSLLASYFGGQLRLHSAA